MSKRAEEFATEQYPEKWKFNKNATGQYDTRLQRRKACIKGYEQAEKDLSWHSVDESLPPVDEEVIVLTDELNTAPIYKIAFGHIVNPELTVEVGDISYTPMSYGGWNIDGVKYWMPMPKIPKEE